MKLKITYDGNPWSVKVVDHVTGEPLEGVMSVRLNMDTNCVTCDIQLASFDVDVTAEANVSGQTSELVADEPLIVEHHVGVDPAASHDTSVLFTVNAETGRVVVNKWSDVVPVILSEGGYYLPTCPEEINNSPASLPLPEETEKSWRDRPPLL